MNAAIGPAASQPAQGVWAIQLAPEVDDQNRKPLLVRAFRPTDNQDAHLRRDITGDAVVVIDVDQPDAVADSEVFTRSMQPTTHSAVEDSGFRRARRARAATVVRPPAATSS